jgi:hypothetical protein
MFWAFHPRKDLYVKLIAKLVVRWLPLYDVPIPLKYIKVFFNILGAYL